MCYKIQYFFGKQEECIAELPTPKIPLQDFFFKNSKISGFKYNDVTIEEVSELNYLGIILDPKCNFNDCVNSLSNKASKTMYTLMKTINANNIRRAQSLHFGEGVFGSYSADFGSTSDNFGSKYLLW
jgi:hypothetical protein